MSMARFWKEHLSPITLSLIIALVLYLTSRVIREWNLFLTLMIKGFIFVIVFALYIQLTKEYDLIGKMRNIMRSRNTKL